MSMKYSSAKMLTAGVESRCFIFLRSNARVKVSNRLVSRMMLRMIASFCDDLLELIMNLKMKTLSKRVDWWREQKNIFDLFCKTCLKSLKFTKIVQECFLEFGQVQAIFKKSQGF